MTERRAHDPPDYDGREFRAGAQREQEPGNGLVRLLTAVFKGGPWALIVVIVLTALAGEYGILNSQTRRNAEAIEKYGDHAKRQQESLDRILTVLEEQRRIQAQAALIACFKEAKQDADRTECIRKFPVK